jgi:predicted AlkP superfamily pyrophosphatase or phosphodiesterase
MRMLVLLAALIPAAAYAEPEKPKLVVLVVFDQLRGDYLEKWKPLFGPDGFARLQRDGVWFDNCHYPYAVTVTGAGHASMLTGCGPDTHGIIGNTWYDRRSGAVVNCSESDRYTRVPPLPKVLPKDDVRADVKAAEEEERKAREAKNPPAEKKAEEPKPKGPAKPKPYGCPDRLLVPTFGDALKAATGGRGRVFGLSFKDRSAVLPVGGKADGAYWLDSADGMIVTSTFYRDVVHPWVATFNQQRIADRWFSRPWELSRGDVDYVRFSGPDKMFGEGKGSRQGIVFPHPMDGGLKRIGKAYYDALYNSPYGNDFLLEFVKAAVVAEKLGQDDTPDLLAVSFSSNDAVGHTWGPDSQEVLDTTLRSDRMLAEFLTFLDATVGKGKYVVCLTADHGICPIPEVAAANGLDAKRVPMGKYLTAAEAHLRSVYEKVGKAAKTKWIENKTSPWLYLNHKAIRAKGLDPADVAKTLAEFLAAQDGVLRTFSRAELEREPDRYDTIARRMKKSYHPDRSGDVAVVLKPYYLEGDNEYPTGTTHGSPHAYDTHVPLLVFGTNVKPGVRKEEVPPALIAAIFAKALGIAPPKTAEYACPDGVFKE